MAVISRKKAAALLKSARRIIGTLDEPEGKPDPELAAFIRGIRVKKHVERVSKTALDVTFQFDLGLAPKMPGSDLNDFKEALIHDMWRRMNALGIEHGVPFAPVWGRGWFHGHIIFPVKAKSRTKVEKMLRDWKRGVPPAEPE